PARPQFRGVCPRRSAQPTGRTHHRPAANQLTKTFGCFRFSFTPDFPKFHESNQQLRHLTPPPSLSAGLYWSRGLGPFILVSENGIGFVPPTLVLPSLLMPTNVSVLNNGPIRIEGVFEILDPTGAAFGLAGRTVNSLCRCGQSAN